MCNYVRMTTCAHERANARNLVAVFMAGKPLPAAPRSDLTLLKPFFKTMRNELFLCEKTKNKKTVDQEIESQHRGVGEESLKQRLDQHKQATYRISQPRLAPRRPGENEGLVTLALI